jgi:starch synthase
MDEITQLVFHPVQNWDALICTSQSVKTHVELLIQQQLDYFAHRFGVTALKPSLPMLPVIPPGVDCGSFATSDDETKQARSSLGIGAEEVVILFVGRLSFHAKAHPLAMYQALHAAGERAGKTIRLIECGWFANDYIEKAFDEAAQQACPSIHRLVLDIGMNVESRFLSNLRLAPAQVTTNSHPVSTFGSKIDFFSQESNQRKTRLQHIGIIPRGWFLFQELGRFPGFQSRK